MKKKLLALALACTTLFVSCGKKDGESVNVTNYEHSVDRSASNGGGTETDPSTDPDAEPTATPEPVDTTYEYTLCFAGDLCFDDRHYTMDAYHENGDDISKVISPGFIDIMKAADIFWLNNEFTYTDRGEPTPDKMYTFRTDPKYVSILFDLGADIVGLANNHTYDYGEVSLLDTLETLEDAGMPYVGAGRNLDEAKAPVYMTVGNKTIAYVAASRAEGYAFTPQATEDSPGILRCYDDYDLFIESIEEAAANADFVIALPHWGLEHLTILEDEQVDGAKALIDAGADAVIGAHTHCLQAIDFYNGKPIIYSLGNFWFIDEYDQETMLAELIVSGDDATGEENITLKITPGFAVQGTGITEICDTPEWRREIFDYVESISEDISIDDDGIVTKTE